jgi:hypothetical protein
MHVADFIGVVAALFPLFRGPFRLGRQLKVVFREKSVCLGNVAVDFRSLHSNPLKKILLQITIYRAAQELQFCPSITL